MHIHLHILAFFHSTFVRRLIGALTGSMIALAGYHAFETGVNAMREAHVTRAEVVERLDEQTDRAKAIGDIADRVRAAMEQKAHAPVE